MWRKWRRRRRGLWHRQRRHRGRRPVKFAIAALLKASTEGHLTMSSAVQAAQVAQQVPALQEAQVWPLSNHIRWRWQSTCLGCLHPS